ncbi:DUF559 domain-containing protein [Nocardioides sp.]|uniref:DUF559 domain-containing protein n=1 Tax=Nocardioides sp. TaxID=35761 RepID=UPI0039E29A74
MTVTDLPTRPFCLAELATLGLTRKRLRLLVAEGAVRRVAAGAFVPASLPDTTATRAAALGLVVPRHHVVIDRTAAMLHGIDTYAIGEQVGTPAVESCALRGNARPRAEAVDGHTRDLRPTDVMRIDRVRVTTPLRTSLDLGCQLRRREAFAAMCQFARDHHVTADLLTRQLPRFKGRRGVVQLRELAPLVEPRVESAREAWTLLAIVEAGLPVPEPQFWIVLGGVATYRLDFAYPQRRVCVEYDGIEAHEKTSAQKARDRRRRHRLRDLGWTVIVVRRGDFTGDRLDAWLRELRLALVAPYSTRRW